jgi:hypothetical protein
MRCCGDEFHTKELMMTSVSREDGSRRRGASGASSEVLERRPRLMVVDIPHRESGYQLFEFMW